MKLNKILIVNDDAEDIVAFQERLPSGLEVLAASQFQARMQEQFPYDLVVLDNDANNLQESKGRETLDKIRQRNPNVPVIYTSFQPGHVPGEVFQTLGVQVVRTDELPDVLQARFEVKLKPEKKKKEASPQVNLIITYNDVNGYQEGTFSNGRLIILANDKRAYQAAREVLLSKVRAIYGSFEWRRDRDLIRNVFVYDGVHGGEYPGQVATGLGHDIRMRVNLLACGCDWERKQRLANRTDINLYQVECSGRRTLGAIADVILGIRRPGVDYSRLAIPPEKILEPAERFRI